MKTILIVLVLLLTCSVSMAGDLDIVDKLDSTIRANQVAYGRLGVQCGIQVVTTAMLIQLKTGVHFTSDELIKMGYECLDEQIDEIRKQVRGKK